MKNKKTDIELAIEDQYPKLVRDKIPQIIESHGKKADIRILTNDEEYSEYLLAKLVEEACELAKAKSKGSQIEELADVMEVLEAVFESKNLTLPDIVLAQNQKRQVRGGFKKRLLMLKKP